MLSQYAQTNIISPFNDTCCPRKSGEVILGMKVYVNVGLNIVGNVFPLTKKSFYCTQFNVIVFVLSI